MFPTLPGPTRTLGPTETIVWPLGTANEEGESKEFLAWDDTMVMCGH